MKKFDFRLQRVLDVKSTIEDLKRRNFLTAKAVFDQNVLQLGIMYQDLKKYSDELNGLAKEEQTYQIINIYYSYFNSLSERINHQKGMIELAKQEMEKRRLELVDAVKDRKIMDKLKEKKHLEYLHESEVEEQNHLDEISGSSYTRKEKLIELED